jgi:hypothetical protein
MRNKENIRFFQPLSDVMMLFLGGIGFLVYGKIFQAKPCCCVVAVMWYRRLDVWFLALD